MDMLQEHLKATSARLARESDAQSRTYASDHSLAGRHRARVAMGGSAAANPYTAAVRQETLAEKLAKMEAKFKH